VLGGHGRVLQSTGAARMNIHKTQTEAGDYTSASTMCLLVTPIGQHEAPASSRKAPAWPMGTGSGHIRPPIPIRGLKHDAAWPLGITEVHTANRETVGRPEPEADERCREDDGTCI